MANICSLSNIEGQHRPILDQPYVDEQADLGIQCQHLFVELFCQSRTRSKPKGPTAHLTLRKCMVAAYLYVKCIWPNVHNSSIT